MREDAPGPKELGYYIALAQVCLEMIAPLLIGIAVDYYFGSNPWGTVAGAVFGFVGGLTHLIVLVNRHDAVSRSDRDRESK